MNTEKRQILDALLSESECLLIVRNSLKLPDDVPIKLKSYKVTCGANNLVGFMGEYLFLNIILADEANTLGKRELQFFVKSVPIFNEYHKNECERKHFFDKETLIYRDILPNIQRYATQKLYPESYYMRKDLIVLEDLAAQGFCHRPEQDTNYDEHNKLVLQLLAQLHAGSLAWEAAENFNIGKRFGKGLFEIQLSMNNTWYVTGAKSLLFLCTMIPELQTPEIQKFINEKFYQLLCRAEDFTNPSEKFRNVFCHRDTWDRNILFKYDTKTGKPIKCRIVDFQLTRYSPPAIDVLYFIYCTTPYDRRATVCNKALDFYYATLQQRFRDLKLNENLITKAEFEQDCKKAMVVTLLLSAICVPLMEMPEGLANKWRGEDPEKFDIYMNEKRNEFFLRVMEIDATYKQKILTPVKDLVNYLMKYEEIY